VRVFAFAALFAISCGPGLAPGYRALTLGARVGGQIESDLGSICKARRVRCEAGHPAPDMLTACELPCLRALRVWAAVRVRYNAAAEIAWGSLETARIAQRSDATWLDKLRPGVCAVLRAIEQLRPILGEKVTSWLATLVTIQGLACGGVP